MIPSRDAALQALDDFLPRAPRYAATRNFDLGPDDRSNVSTLSPHLRLRLVTEEEVTRRVLDRHAVHTVEKFLQEVAWRTYWKGWLERRPVVWTRYLDDVDALKNRHHPGLDAALAGRTGIEPFDHWTRELIATGYLHNHARMWFASIWIFTLRLPWQLGADFFLRHLLDGDPASNTLSWRWVAGLHTRGKHYLARASNVARFTHGRFDPAGQLAENAPPLEQPEPPAEPAPLELPPGPASLPPRTGLLLHLDDLGPLPPDLRELRPRAILDHDLPGSSPKVREFRRGALDDAAQRFEAEILETSAVPAWAERHSLDAIVTLFAPVGAVRAQLDSLDLPVPLHRILRDWDRELWPHANAGFFKLRKKLPALWRRLASS